MGPRAILTATAGLMIMFIVTVWHELSEFATICLYPNRWLGRYKVAQQPDRSYFEMSCALILEFRVNGALFLANHHSPLRPRSSGQNRLW